MDTKFTVRDPRAIIVQDIEQERFNASVETQLRVKNRHLFRASGMKSALVWIDAYMRGFCPEEYVRIRPTMYRPVKLRDPDEIIEEVKEDAAAEQG